MFLFFAFLAAMAGGYPIAHGGMPFGQNGDAGAIVVRGASPVAGIAHTGRSGQDSGSGQPSLTIGSGGGTGGNSHARHSQDSGSGQPSK